MINCKLLDDSFKEIESLDEIIKKLEYHLNNLDKIPKIEEQEQIQNLPVMLKEESSSDYDEFFNYILNNELPAGKSVESSNTKITGVNDNILKNYAIYLHQKGYTAEKLESEIKPIYEKNNWSFAGLKGWFEKANKGEIKRIGHGELINWCKIYFPDLLGMLPYRTYYLTADDLEYSTVHMPKFEIVNDTVKLIGQEYKLAKKEIFNFLISCACPEHLIIMKLGQIETDLRLHPLFIMPSGKGKLEIKEGTKRIYQQFKPDAKIKESRTIHPQQLIGKILSRLIKGTKQRETIKKYGFIFSDFLILEECYEIFTSREKNDRDCRDAIIVGLDIYGHNLIQKQNIDDLDIDAETISGYPKVRCMAFSQPLGFLENFVTKGTIRRFDLVYKKFSNRTNIDNFAARLFSQEVSPRKINPTVNSPTIITAIQGVFVALCTCLQITGRAPSLAIP